MQLHMKGVYLKRKFSKDTHISDSKSRVTLHKSGKHWVSTLTHFFDLLRLSGGLSRKESVSLSESQVRLSNPSGRRLARGAAILGAIVGGAGLGQAVYAEDTEEVYEADKAETVVGQDSLVLLS